MLNVKKLLMQLEGRKLLWTNPNPSGSFAAQSVTISGITDFDTIEIEYYGGATNSRFRCEEDSMCQAVIPAWASIPTYRNATITASGIGFSDAYEKSQTVNNTLVVPYRIYGIRKLGG